MTQAQKILRHLQSYGSITPHDALREYSVMRLAARVNDLKKQGHYVHSNMVKDKNRFGEPVRYAVYYLLDDAPTELK